MRFCYNLLIKYLQILVESLEKNDNYNTYCSYKKLYHCYVKKYKD